LRSGTATLAAFLLTLAWGGDTSAADYVDLQLVIAVDTSRSIEFDEQRLQRQGYVAAFRNADVLKAIASGPIGRIAVTYIEWSNSFDQRIVVPWRILGGAEDALGFAEELERVTIGLGQRTSISGALSFALEAFAQSRVESDRRTIDVSGDGANNEGRALSTVRAQVISQGITINGLPLLIGSTHVNPYPQDLLDEYYEDCVIGGPGSFIVVANGPREFESAIRRKLILEIATLPPPDSTVVPVSQNLLRPRIDCQRVDGVSGIFP
jgi:hypothetical protein